MPQSSEDSVTNRARLLTELCDDVPEDQSLLKDIQEPLVDLIGEIKLETHRGSLARMFFNNLLQDLHIMEEAGKRAAQDSNDDWILPYLDSLLAKLILGQRLHQGAGERFHKIAELLGRMRHGQREWGTVRLMLGGLLSGPTGLGLRKEAQKWLSQGDGLKTLASLRSWSTQSSGPPIFLSSIGQIIESLALHLALNEAEGIERGAKEEAIQATLDALSDWLETRGVEALAPELGSMMSGKERVVFRRVALGSTRRGSIDRVIAPAFMLEGVQLARATVLVSPGTSSQVLELANEILLSLPDSERSRRQASLTILRERLWHLLDDVASSFIDCAVAALDLVESLRCVDKRRYEIRMVRAFERDFDDTGLDLMMPKVGSPPGAMAESRAAYSEQVEAGRVIEIKTLGLKAGDEVIRKPVVLVSMGAPPPGPVDDMCELLRTVDEDQEQPPEVCMTLAARLEEARNAAPGDDSRSLAQQLLGLLCEGGHPEIWERIDDYALELILAVPGPALSRLYGWRDLALYLDENWDLSDWDSNSRRLIRCLFRPYYEALLGHPRDEADLPLKRLTAALAVALGPVSDGARHSVLGWVWTQLSRLDLSSRSYSKDCLRNFAQALGTTLTALWAEHEDPGEGEDSTPLEAAYEALKTAGLMVFPQLDRHLDRCDDPELFFHRFDARYNNEVPRSRIFGPVYPGVRVQEWTEAGYARISLGPRPRVVQWFRSRQADDSPFAWARKRLLAEISSLDRRRLIAELQGDPQATKNWRQSLTQLLKEALERCRWSPEDKNQGSLEKLIEILKTDEQIELF